MQKFILNYYKLFSDVVEESNSGRLLGLALVDKESNSHQGKDGGNEELLGRVPGGKDEGADSSQQPLDGSTEIVAVHVGLDGPAAVIAQSVGVSL